MSVARRGLQYRPEIDGLRALAIIPVMLFHAGLPGFAGGFVGVDVFFVISGYLISSLLMAEHDVGVFSLATFYERRARRILPALFFMVICLLPFAWLWMVPSELKEFGDNLMALPLFVSNFLLSGQAGYFATEAEVKPLLHIWSLAVEEQFYIIYPLMLMLLWRSGRRAIITGCMVLAVLSFVAAERGVWSSYLLPAGRIWELLAGVFCALWLRGRADKTDPGVHWPGLVGIAMIAASIAFYGKSTPFPSYYTLLPVLGTALVIVNAGAGNAVGRLLAHPILVGVGLISYSAYLWHQPLFAFARIRLIDAPSNILLVALVGISLGLGWLSWRFIERPFRGRARFTQQQIFVMAAVAGLAIAAVGLTVHLADGFPARVKPGYEAATQPTRSDPQSCAWISPLAGAALIQLCPMGASGGSPLLLFGDSHADALYAGFDQRLKERNRSGYLVKNPYCPPVKGLYDWANMSSAFVQGCEDTNRELFAYLAGLKPSTIVLADRWTYRAFPIAGLIDRQTYDNGEGGVEPEYYTESFAVTPSGVRSQAVGDKAAALTAGIEQYFAFGVPVVLVYPVPETGWNIPKRNAKKLLFSGSVETLISTSQARFKLRNRFIDDTLDAIQSPQLLRVKPEQLLCGSFIPGRCAAQLDGIPLYYDDDHLSLDGAALVVDEIFRVLAAKQ
ncbi:MAG: acyltransferase 3 [Devosia sp.]|uniref:acyltransferase family protein n=1 Tax=Devosia sp. TaxID=1871048 RepID=UPI00260AA81B|nr:acyltransferase family protein [Devosia sp.]MDB5526944.1 acyltransferase 3 [Devosia sp.]